MNRVAYFLDSFPALTETFVREEMFALRRKGWQVRPDCPDQGTVHLEGRWVLEG